VADIGIESGKELFRMLDALDGIEARFRLAIVLLG
jgi:hypothetical protein